MKNLPLRFRLFATTAVIWTLLGVPLAAQSHAPAPDKLSWQQAPSPELHNLHVRLDEIVRRDGNAKSDDARDLEHAIMNVEGRLPWVLSFDFPGGPLSKFLALIAKADVVSFSIIASNDQADLETILPPFALHNVPLGTIRHVLHNLLLPRGLTLNPAEGGNDQQMVGVLARLAPAAAKSAPPPPQLKSFQLGEYLSKTLSVDDVVDAIRTAWKMDPARIDGDLQIKFHPATKILFVSGPEPAAFIATQVIEGLRKKPVVQ